MWFLKLEFWGKFFTRVATKILRRIWGMTSLRIYKHNTFDFNTNNLSKSCLKSVKIFEETSLKLQYLYLQPFLLFYEHSELEKLSVNNKEPSILEKLETTQANILQKQALLKQLQKNFNSLKTDEHTREFYTSRILDLVKQIEKLR